MVVIRQREVLWNPNTITKIIFWCGFSVTYRRGDTVWVVCHLQVWGIHLSRFHQFSGSTLRMTQTLSSHEACVVTLRFDGWTRASTHWTTVIRLSLSLWSEKFNKEVSVTSIFCQLFIIGTNDAPFANESFFLIGSFQWIGHTSQQTGLNRFEISLNDSESDRFGVIRYLENT